MSATGSIWAVAGADDGEVLAEARRIAGRLATEGDETGEDARPRVVAVVFDGVGDPGDGLDRADELLRLVREDGSFREGSAGVRARAEALRDLATDRGERPLAVLLPGTPDGDELAAAAAGTLGGGCVTGCLLRVRDGELLAGRDAYGERAYAELSFEGGSAVISLDTAVLDPPAGLTGEIPEEQTLRVEVDDDEGVRRIETREVPERDLERARRIVAGGYGLGGPDGFEVVRELADALGASVGASRPPADEEWVPYDRQIGVTGREIDVDLYVPCAISGDPYHMRSVEAEHLIAINVDPEARVFGAADLGIVGDVFEYGPAIAEAIREATGAEMEATR